LFYIASDIQVTVLDSPSAFQECIFLLLKGRGTSLSQNQLLLGNIYRSPNSTQDNDNELYKMLSYIQQHYNVPKLIVVDFNFSNIRWYDTYDFGANAICSNLTDNELRCITGKFFIPTCFTTYKTTRIRHSTHTRFNYNV